MKETLRKRIEDMLQKFKDRIELLKLREQEYRDNGDYSKALDSYSKSSELTSVVITLETLLKIS